MLAIFLAVKKRNPREDLLARLLRKIISLPTLFNGLEDILPIADLCIAKSLNPTVQLTLDCLIFNFRNHTNRFDFELHHAVFWHNLITGWYFGKRKTFQKTFSDTQYSMFDDKNLLSATNFRMF